MSSTTPKISACVPISKRPPGPMAIRLLNKIFRLNHGRGAGFGANMKLEEFRSDRDLWSKVNGELKPPSLRTLRAWKAQLLHHGLAWSVKTGKRCWYGETAAGWDYIRTYNIEWFMRLYGEHPETRLGKKYNMHSAEVLGHKDYVTVTTVVEIGEQKTPRSEQPIDEQLPQKGERSTPFCLPVPYPFRSRSPIGSPVCSPSLYVPVQSTKKNVRTAAKSIPETPGQLWLQALQKISGAVSDQEYNQFAKLWPEKYGDTLYLFGPDVAARFIHHNHRTRVQDALRQAGYRGDFRVTDRAMRPILQRSMQAKKNDAA